MKFLAVFAIFYAVAYAIPLGVGAVVAIGNGNHGSSSDDKDNSNNDNQPTTSGNGCKSSSNDDTTTQEDTPSTSLCPAGLYSNPQCCSTDVLGVAALDCQSPSSEPDSKDAFKSLCNADSRKPKCCVLPVAGQDILCHDV